MLKWFIVNTLSLLIITYILPGFIISNWKTAVFAVLVIGLINITIKPILSLLTLPITIVTLGLFSFILNALLLLLAANIVPGFQINGFLTALLASLLMGFISGVLSKIAD